MPVQSPARKKYTGLHPIDRPNGPYSDSEMENYMVFCILDAATNYDSVCRAYDGLDRYGLTSRENLRKATVFHIKKVLEESHYRFPKEKAKYLFLFGRNNIDLKYASREEIVKNIIGIDPKLASMFVRSTRGEKAAVIDTHIKNWLKEQGIDSNDYYKLERSFFELAESLGKDPTELDMEIWEERRRKSGQND